MPSTTRAVACRLCFVLSLFIVGAGHQHAFAGMEQDQFEEKTIARSVERFVRTMKSDRALWMKELSAAFPDKVGDPVKLEEYTAWFDLLAGEDATDWRRTSVTNTRLAPLFDRVVQRLELGPVPFIKRDEFLRYARKVLMQGNPRSEDSDSNEEPDRVFRVLDSDGDGILQPEEMTTRLREERLKADIDVNGRIDKEEYRGYYRRRVSANADIAIKAAELKERGSDSRTITSPDGTSLGVPGWFSEVDEDEDGQVALSEWRKSGRDIAAYQEMDLDGDGLLTKQEYTRFAQMKAKEAAANMPPHRKFGKK